MLVGDAKFFFALGEFACHIVKRSGKRLEFGKPAFLRSTHMKIAAAEPGSGAHQ